MKQAAIRRIKREMLKRQAFAKRESVSTLNFFIRTSLTNPNHEIRLAGRVVKHNRRFNVSHCRKHCLITGRGHSMYSHYKLTRNEFKRLAHKGCLFGIKKAS